MITIGWFAVYIFYGISCMQRCTLVITEMVAEVFYEFEKIKKCVFFFKLKRIHQSNDHFY